MEKFFINITASLHELLLSLGMVASFADLATVFLVGAAVLVALLLNVMLFVYLERKVSGFIQQRPGPNRVGPAGIFQVVLDVVKLLGKETITPTRIDKWPYIIAPVIVFIPAMLLFIVLPFGKNMIVADLDIGLFYYFAIAGVATIILLMAGWGSNNKYSLLGAMRAVAQTIGYEIPLVFSVLGIIMITGSLRISDIVGAQEQIWFAFSQPLAFFIFLIASTAEIHRGPFDLQEGEQELIAGVYTEYSGMRFAFFYMVDYVHLLAMSMLIVVLFLGGWHGPAFLPSWAWMMLKTYLMVFVNMWVRWTFPRIRIDHFMSLNWKFLLPLAIINLILTGAVIKVMMLF